MLTSRLALAFNDALMWHAGQVRKGTRIPYVSHLLGVASLVLEQGGGENAAIAALLHDVVEDCGGAPRLGEIRERYGESVAAIVAGCTDTDVFPKPSWRARKEAYIAHLRAPGTPAEVALVSCCDKLHNARSILSELHVVGETVWSKFNGGRDGTLWYYTELVAAYRQLPVSQFLVDELERTVAAVRQRTLPAT